MKSEIEEELEIERILAELEYNELHKEMELEVENG